MNVQHSSRSDLWYTPNYIVSLAHSTLGQIDLDPASDVEANKVVKASKIITAEQDALSLDFWCYYPRTIFMNPPGSKLKGKSKSILFWDKLMHHYKCGLVKHAIVIGFSIEQLAISQQCEIPMTEFLCCIPRKRIAFVDPNNDAKSSPSHSNVIVYIPGKIDKSELFKHNFSSLGSMVTKA
jgi:DNA N-6-adenine-methyltransferase (Dam)